MSKSPHHRVLLNLCGTEVVTAAYRAILGRQPDAAGLAGYSARLGRPGRLPSVLEELAGSDEARRRALVVHADALVRELAEHLRDGNAQAEELAEWAQRLRSGASIGEVAELIARSPAQWRRLAQHDPDTLVEAAFVTLLGRHPAVPEQAQLAATLRETGSLAALLGAVADMPEHRQSVLDALHTSAEAEGITAVADEIIAAMYEALLVRDVDAEGHANYLPRLKGWEHLAPVLREVARSEEAWQVTLKARAATLVRQLHGALSDADATPDDLAAWAASLASTGDLGAVAASLATGQAHWRKVLRTDPNPMVIAAYTALLGRYPSQDELSAQAATLAQTTDLPTFLSDIGRSAEHRAQLGAGDEAPLAGSAPDHAAVVEAAFQALLGRPPEPAELAQRVEWLASTGDLTAFLAELGASKEHRKRVLLARN